MQGQLGLDWVDLVTVLLLPVSSLHFSEKVAILIV